MEDKIEVGEYVRLTHGKIDRVKNNNYYMQQYIECEKGLYPRENIIKHSKNIIELIEVDDYVNGYLVTEIYDEMVQCLDGEIEYWKNEIHTIVTHEQFKQVQYKVGD